MTARDLQTSKTEDLDDADLDLVHGAVLRRTLRGVGDALDWTLDTVAGGMRGVVDAAKSGSNRPTGDTTGGGGARTRTRTRTIRVE